jgi:hypothetical protein
MTADQKFTSQDDAEIRSLSVRWARAVREEDRAAIRESHSANEASAAARHASTSELLAVARRRARFWARSQHAGTVNPPYVANCVAANSDPAG